MNTELLALKGIISEQPKEFQDKVHAMVAELRERIKAEPEGVGMLAIAMLGIEMQGDSK
jgi:hypothetical protein